MPSTFLGLNTAYSGLVAYQASLNVTGNNMANVDTDGYTRQQTTQTASTPLRTNTSYGMIGTGVTTTGISQIRDVYYDMKYWSNNCMYGEYSIKDYYMKQIQNYFLDNEDLEISGFNTLFSDMFSALEDCKNSGADISVRNQFIQAAQQLTEYFNSLSNNLLQIQEECNSLIKTKVDEVNTIAQKIAQLNKQINTVELTGATANELRDARNLLIDQLSAIGPVEVTETPVTDPNYPNMTTGANTYTVTFYGYTLVSTNNYNTLTVEARENKVNQTDADGLYEIKWSDGEDFVMQNKTNGELKALLEMRDGNNQENFTGTVASSTAAGGYYTSITVNVTGSTYTDISRCNLSEKGTIQIGNMEVEYDGFTYDSAAGTFTFNLASGSNLSDTIAIGGMNCSIGDSIDYMGIPYYMTQLNEFVRNFAEAFNEIHLTGEDLNGDAAGLFFVTTGEETALSDTDYYNMTAANIKVSAALLKDASLMATSTDISSGQDNTDLVDLLLKVKSDAGLVNFRGGSAEEFLQCLISDISLNTKTADSFSNNYKNIKETIKNQRLSISGVDNDEEGVNMVRFQNAYNYCAQMMQVMSEIYDRLILETGV